MGGNDMNINGGPLGGEPEGMEEVKGEGDMDEYDESILYEV
jgi:hypothetical protein